MGRRQYETREFRALPAFNRNRRRHPLALPAQWLGVGVAIGLVVGLLLR